MQSSDQDETLSWQAAAVIMIVVTLAALVSRILGSDPFTEIFDLFIVYLPTAVLVGGILYTRSRHLLERTS